MERKWWWLAICVSGLMLTSAGMVVWCFVHWWLGVPMVSIGIGTAIGSGIVAARVLGIYEV